MSFNDAIGLFIILLVLLGGLYGLHRISKPVSYSKEEYEKRLREGSGIARGAMNALMHPFEELLHPKAVEAAHVLRDLKAGHYDAQQENGDGIDEDRLTGAENGEVPAFPGRRQPIGLLRLFLNAFRLRR